MWFEESLPSGMRFGNIKLFMRITLVLWLLAAALGIITYVRLYEPFDGDDDAGGAPVSTPEATEETPDDDSGDAPDETPVPEPAETEEMPEPEDTEEAPEPTETEESPEPAQTEEAE